MIRTVSGAPPATVVVIQPIGVIHRGAGLAFRDLHAIVFFREVVHVTPPATNRPIKSDNHRAVLRHGRPITPSQIWASTWSAGRACSTGFVPFRHVMALTLIFSGLYGSTTNSGATHTFAFDD